MNPVNNLEEGIEVGLNETLEKHSEKLDKNSEFTKASRMASLPKYLVV